MIQMRIVGCGLELSRDAAVPQSPARTRCAHPQLSLGRAYDNASGNDNNPEDYQNKDFNWGPSDFDRTHVLVGTWTWQMPFFSDADEPCGIVQGVGAETGRRAISRSAPLTDDGQQHRSSSDTRIWLAIHTAVTQRIDSST